MQIHFGTDLLQPEWSEAVCCIGTFDGVHLGHQAVIGEAIRQAEALEAPSIVVTFDRHPASVLMPEKCPKPIASPRQNVREFERMGVSLALVLPFDRHLADTEAETFFQQILLDKCKAKSIVVGHDFAFGHNRVGTPDWLKSHIETTVVPPFEIDAERVSSSKIRAAIGSGDLPSAEKWLGRPFSIEGVVVRGQKMGRQLGFPTANIARSNDCILPPDGVYAGVCETPHGAFLAAVSIGLRPTFADQPRTIEAYLLDYPAKSLYGASVWLRLTGRIREQRAFASLEDLKAQIEKDVEAVRA